VCMGQNEWDEDDDDEEEIEDESEWDEDEDLDEAGETEDEARERESYMDENYPDLWKEGLSDSEKLDMMAENDCSECGGPIDKELDSTEQNIVACSDCAKEYTYCSTCPGYYDAFLMECPNDH
jgi:hypothetical protein